MIIKFIKKEIADFLMYRYGYKIEVTHTITSNSSSHQTKFVVRAKESEELIEKVLKKVGYANKKEIKTFIYSLKIHSFKEKTKVLEQYSNNHYVSYWKNISLTLKKL